MARNFALTSALINYTHVLSTMRNWSEVIIERDPHIILTGASRSILALGTFLTLIATPRQQLFFRSPNYPRGVSCLEEARTLSLYCLQDPYSGQIAYIISIVVLLTVMVGAMPWLTSILHFWVAWSFVKSVPVIDGGDQVAVALTGLFVIFHFGDLRSHHWKIRDDYSTQPAIFRIIWWSALALFSIQGLVIYAHAFIGKLSVPEWSNGTSVWYWLNDPTFTPPQPIKFMLLQLSNSWIGTVLLNYGVLAVEALLAFAITFSSRNKMRMSVIGIMLHFIFAITFGLWSFMYSMICVLTMYLIVPSRLSSQN